MKWLLILWENLMFAIVGDDFSGDYIEYVNSRKLGPIELWCSQNEYECVTELTVFDKELAYTCVGEFDWAGGLFGVYVDGELHSVPFLSIAWDYIKHRCPFDAFLAIAKEYLPKVRLGKDVLTDDELPF